MSSPQIERKLAAIMFTDIAGYTESMSKSESKTLNLLEKQNLQLKKIVADKELDIQVLKETLNLESKNF